MKKRIQDSGWFRVFFIDYPIGYILAIAMAVGMFMGVSQNIEIPVYETGEAVVRRDKDGYYIAVEEGLGIDSAPFYLYQIRDQYVEKVEDYTIDEQRKVIYFKDTAFEADDEIFVDAESRRVTLLEYLLSQGGF